MYTRNIYMICKWGGAKWKTCGCCTNVIGIVVDWLLAVMYARLIWIILGKTWKMLGHMVKDMFKGNEENGNERIASQFTKRLVAVPFTRGATWGRSRRLWRLGSQPLECERYCSPRRGSRLKYLVWDHRKRRQKCCRKFHRKHRRRRPIWSGWSVSLWFCRAAVRNRHHSCRRQPPPGSRSRKCYGPEVDCCGRPEIGPWWSIHVAGSGGPTGKQTTR